MVIKCIFSLSLEPIRSYAKQITELPLLPEYINKRGPYVDNKGGAAHQIN
jgi:hypothetical protein